MTTVEIYGASDDLIEVEGDIAAEFSPDGEHVAVIAVSDGTLLRVEYTDSGLWKITRLAKGAATFSQLYEATDPDGEYSDKVQLHGAFSWVALTTESNLARTQKESR